MVKNQLKEKLKRGETAIGTFMISGSPDLTEILALAGFDFIIVDNEHGPSGAETTMHMIRAAEARGITPIVRIPDHQESSVLHYLDIGAHGLQIPGVHNAAEARELAEYAKYDPQGSRGIAFSRSSDYGICDIASYFDRANEETMMIVHCEDKESLDHIEEICQVPEVDVVFLGPFDMSQSLGIKGQIDSPLIEQAAQKVLDTCRKYGKIAGIYCGSGEIARKRSRQGFQYCPIGMDVTLFADKCLQEVKNFRNG